MPIDLVILGPPGSGKTRTCITACREWFKKHRASASEVAYLAFTTAAADEAAGRILDEDIQRDVGDRLPFFKTIHSVAFRGMKTERRDIRPVLAQDMKYFSTLSGYEGTFAVNNTGDSLAEAYQISEVQSSTIWDRCLVAYNLTRASATNRAHIEASQRTFSAPARRLVGYLEEEAYQGFVKAYEHFKLANGLVDFTDMLVYAMTQMAPFDKVKYVVVDECLPAGTSITMADGRSKLIEQVELGDKVLGFDHESDSAKPATVIEKRVRMTHELVVINEKLHLTPNHPVFIVGKGYVESAQVQVGDRILLCGLREAGTSPKGRGQKRTDDVFTQMRSNVARPREDCHAHLSALREIDSSSCLQNQQIGWNAEVLLERLLSGLQTSKIDAVDLRDLRKTGLQGPLCDRRRTNHLFEKMRKRPEKEQDRAHENVRPLREAILPVSLENEPSGRPTEVLLQKLLYGSQGTESLFRVLRDVQETLREKINPSWTEASLLRERMRPSAGASTDQSEKQARRIHAFDEIVPMGVREMREGSGQDGKAVRWQDPTFLQRPMRGKVEIQQGRHRQALRADEEQQSHEGSFDTEQDEKYLDPDKPSAFDSWRQWTRIDQASILAARSLGRSLDAGIGHEHDHSGVEMGETGPFPSSPENGGGMRWGFPWNIEAKNHRSNEGEGPPEDGMDHPPFYESADPGEPGFRCCIDTVRSIEKIRVHVPVFNIGTTTENYFAEGILVHNCQDLSPILNAVVESLFRHAEIRLWAGDDDQCIFSFAAADPQMFIDRARRSRRFFLRETNRFGKEIVDFSMPIIRRVRDRVPKDLIGMSTKAHNIRTTGDFTPVHATKTMLLHRHKAGCQALASMYYREGIPFRNEKGKDPLGPSHAHIIEGFRAFIDLADGKEVHMSAVNDMVQKLMPTQIVSPNGEKKKLLIHGAKKKLEDAKGRTSLMDLVHSKILTLEGANLIATKDYYQLHRTEDLKYYHQVLERGHSLDAGDCTIITTMHSSKGREADRVVIFNERGRRCVEDVDSEHRLAYVAATRTMGDLEICAERNVDWADYPYDYPVREKDGAWR